MLCHEIYLQASCGLGRANVKLARANTAANLEKNMLMLREGV